MQRSSVTPPSSPIRAPSRLSRSSTPLSPPSSPTSSSFTQFDSIDGSLKLSELVTAHGARPPPPGRLQSFRSKLHANYKPYLRNRGVTLPEVHFAHRQFSHASHTAFTMEEMRSGQDLYVRNLQRLPDDILRSAAMAKHATRETSRHKVLLTAWEIEEAERHIVLLKDSQRVNLNSFCLAERELDIFRALLSHRSLPQLQDDVDFLHVVYEEQQMTFPLAEQAISLVERVVVDRGLADDVEKEDEDRSDSRSGTCASSAGQFSDSASVCQPAADNTECCLEHHVVDV